MSVNQQSLTDPDAERRRRAEEQLPEREMGLEGLSLDDTRMLLHELQVHQIELEMQN